MGGGRKRKRRVVALTVAMANAPDESMLGHQEPSVCETPRLVVVNLRRVSGHPESGVPIQVKLGSPPCVYAGRTFIGVIARHDAAPIEACLKAGYAFHGVISAVRSERQQAEARVQGARGA